MSFQSASPLFFSGGDLMLKQEETFSSMGLEAETHAAPSHFLFWVKVSEQQPISRQVAGPLSTGCLRRTSLTTKVFFTRNESAETECRFSDFTLSQLRKFRDVSQPIRKKKILGFLSV